MWMTLLIDEINGDKKYDAGKSYNMAIEVPIDETYLVKEAVQYLQLKLTHGIHRPSSLMKCMKSLIDLGDTRFDKEFVNNWLKDYYGPKKNNRGGVAKSASKDSNQKTPNRDKNKNKSPEKQQSVSVDMTDDASQHE